MPGGVDQKTGWRYGGGCSLLLTGALVMGTLVGATPVGAEGVAPAARSSSPSVTCSVPKIVAFFFKPKVVVEGKSTTLTWKIRNCTGATFSGSFGIVGKIACIYVDPIEFGVDLPAGASKGYHEVFRAPDCTGPGEIDGYLINHKGKVIATGVATVTVVSQRA